MAAGSMVKQAVEAARILAQANIKTTVCNMRFVKPLDTELIDEMAKKGQLLVTLEENALAGGFGSAVLEYLNDSGQCKPVLRFGIKDEFIEQGSCPELLELCGLLPQQIADRLIDFNVNGEK